MNKPSAAAGMSRNSRRTEDEEGRDDDVAEVDRGAITSYLKGGPSERRPERGQDSKGSRSPKGRGQRTTHNKDDGLML